LVKVSAGPLGAQFDFSLEAVGGAVTMDFVRATALRAGSGRLAVAEFRVNSGAATGFNSDLAIARIDIGDATGVRNIAAGQSIGTDNGSVRVNLSSDIDNELNGLPDWWELQYNLDLFNPEGTGDTYGDSVIDFLEYAFGGQPGIPDMQKVAPVASVQEYNDQRYLILTFRRYKAVTRINYLLQESETLAAWETVTPTRDSFRRRSILATTWSR
jgi:hypothetical protein